MLLRAPVLLLPALISLTAASLVSAADPAPPPAPRGAQHVAAPRFLAAEDTIPFVGAADTVLVSAPRVRVSEIIQRIGERMRADEERMGDHAWTSITKVIARKHETDAGDERAAAIDTARTQGGDWTELEIVQRHLRRRDGAFETVRLRQIETKYKDGKLEKRKVDDEVKSDWQELSDSAQAIPFSLESGDEYNYDIERRDIVGDHLIYTIRFEPKSRFKALPAGTVWVDCSDFVIRRVEASLTGAVPLPMLIKSIPFLKARRVRRGDFWVMDDFMAKILLRKVLPGMPSSVELYVQARDHVIDGVPYPEVADDVTAASRPGGR